MFYIYFTIKNVINKEIIVLIIITILFFKFGFIFITLLKKNGL